MLEWTEVDPQAVVPSERYRAVSDRYEYRIYRDPEGSWMIPEDARGKEWWVLAVRELDESSGRRLTEGSTARRTLDEVKRAAQEWEGPS